MVKLVYLHNMHAVSLASKLSKTVFLPNLHPAYALPHRATLPVDIKSRSASK